MKKLALSYTFDASAKTIDCAEFTSLENILLITNVTDHVIIYDFSQASLKGTLAGTTLTLDYDTTSMADTDALQIFVEDGVAVSTNTGAADAGTQRVVIASDQSPIQTDAATDLQTINSVSISTGAGNKGTGTQRITIATDDTNMAAIKTAVEKIDDIVSGAGANISQVGGTNVDTNSGNKSAGTIRIVQATDQPELTNPQGVYQKSTTTDTGRTKGKLICAATTNATSIKASAGKLYYLFLYNSDTVAYWVKLYNKASSPSVGTDVPVMTLEVPAGGGNNVPLAVDGSSFSTGIALATTLNATDADTTAVTTANKLVINYEYI